MALPTIVLCIESRSQDCTIFTIKDESDYGIGGADARNDHAQYLLPYKMDENQVITLIANADNSDPLNSLSWSLTSSGDGAYRFFYLIINFWLVGVNYVEEVIVSEVTTVYPSVVYHSGVVYRAIADNIAIEPGVTGGWETSWEIVTDLEPVKDYVNVATLEVEIHDDIITCAYEECVNEELDKVTDLILCNNCDTIDKILPYLKMQVLLDAAESNNWQEKQVRSELILQEANKKFCNAC